MPAARPSWGTCDLVLGPHRPSWGTSDQVLGPQPPVLGAHLTRSWGHIRPSWGHIRPDPGGTSDLVLGHIRPGLGAHPPVLGHIRPSWGTSARPEGTSARILTTNPGWRLRTLGGHRRDLGQAALQARSPDFALPANARRDDPSRPRERDGGGGGRERPKLARQPVTRNPRLRRTHAAQGASR